MHRFFIAWACGWMLVVLLSAVAQWKGSRLAGRPFKMRLSDILIACITWPLQLLLMLFAVTMLPTKRGAPRDPSN